MTGDIDMTRDGSDVINPMLSFLKVDLFPTFNGKPWNALELIYVVSDKNGRMRQGCCSDKIIIAPYRRALSLKISANLCILNSAAVVKGHYLEWQEERFHTKTFLFSSAALFCTEKELGLHHCRNLEQACIAIHEQFIGYIQFMP